MNNQKDVSLKQKLQEFGLAQSPEKLVSDYPYFGIGHLLVALKNGEKNSKQKAAAYFNNSLWLNWLLENGLDKSPTILPSQQPDQQALKDIPESESVQPEENTPNAVTKTIELQQDIIADPEVFVGENNREKTEETLLAKDDEIQPEVKENLSRLLEEQLNAFKAPIDPKNQNAVASPFFTVDFFASQGIKLSVGSADKLEGKVKKFTEWLSLLKNKSPNPTDLGTDPETEKIIESIAQSSNHTQEVVTETMAEVLIKQGKKQKAIQLYEKLSFLNPSKSAYFAAKIEELK